MKRAVVHIVDDDPGVRDSMSLLLQSAGISSRTYQSASEFLNAFHHDQPGCIVLDYRMPGMTGLELHDHLRRNGCRVPVIIISAYGDIPTAVEAVTSGALTFLEKPFKDDTLLSWIRNAIETDLNNRAQSERIQRLRRQFSQVTQREREILDRVVKGKSSREIAEALDVSQRTIEVHRANIMRKLDASSIAELVRIVVDLEHDANKAR